MVAEDDETSKDKEIDKLMALISLLFKKIYKPTNNNLQTSSNTIRANQDNSLRINRSTGYENQRIGNVAGARETVGSTVVQKSGIRCYNCKEFGHVARECQKPKRVKGAAYHREKMLLCKQEEAGIQLNAEQADWRDDTDDELEDQELEAHYMYMAQLYEVSLDVADSGPIFDTKLVQKVSIDDHYNVFAIESEHPEQSESIHDTYSIEQNEHNVIIDSLDMSYDREQIDQNDVDADLVNERELLASLIEKLKCEIDDSKNRNTFLETSNNVLIEKLKGEIEDFKNKNKSLESSNNHFKEANNKQSETNNLPYTDFKKSQAELVRRNDVEYPSKKEAQLKLYKTREDNELDKVISLENKVKDLDNIVYKTGQSVQMMNMLNNKCRTSFAKPEFLKKAQRANPRLYDIGCYNDNFALMLAPESDEVIRLEKESQSKLSDLIRPFDYDKLNNLYDLFVPQHEKSSKQTYFSERSRLSHTPDLKAQFQDKGIVISELKKLIEKLKGKSVNTKFEKSSVIRQPNAFKSKRPSILGKPTIFSDSLERNDFSKSKSVTQNNVSNDFSKPVTAQTLPPNKKSILKNTNVLAPGMYKHHTEPTQTRTSQLPQDSRKTNKRVSFSTGVISTTSVSRPQLKSNPMGDRVMRNNSQRKKQEVGDQSRSVKFSKNKTSVTACNDSLKAMTLNVNFVCGKCVLKEKHDMCVLKSINGVHSRTKMPIAMPVSTRDPKCTVKQSVAKHLKKTVASESNQKPRNITRKLYEHVSKACSWWYPKFTPSGYKWKPKFEKENVNPNLVEIVLFIVDSGCSKHMTGNLKLLINFVEKFLGTLKFENDQIAPILGYGDLVQGAVTIKRVYYVEGLNHNLFSVGQFCDADLEVAF
uniref:Integrase, catalytic region, zinc finger, CCHC-type, peptidase aspartic, catalytic n=1 Tax=Tanacetum cinerariifolium TaxID=118510 RepID=A0A699HG11_TANCI|nr:integrase, catalytic region, zinc finger, CCHC-type, peptidase aspartic, catalytic [Tanacetum cinerariifolium]